MQTKMHRTHILVLRLLRELYRLIRIGIEHTTMKQNKNTGTTFLLLSYHFSVAAERSAAHKQTHIRHIFHFKWLCHFIHFLSFSGAGARVRQFDVIHKVEHCVWLVHSTRPKLEDFCLNFSSNALQFIHIKHTIVIEPAAVVHLP